MHDEVQLQLAIWQETHCTCWQLELTSMLMASQLRSASCEERWQLSNDCCNLLPQ